MKHGMNEFCDVGTRYLVSMCFAFAAVYGHNHNMGGRANFVFFSFFFDFFPHAWLTTWLLVAARLAVFL